MNKRRHNNQLPVAAVTKAVIGALFLGGIGLCHVSIKNNLHQGGRGIKELERELSELRTNNQSRRATYARLASRNELQRRLEAGDSGLVPISGDRIVRISPVASDVIESVQTVSNPAGGR